MPEQIEQYMRTLKLGGMAREWRNVEFQSTEQYVRELLELELREREVNRINRMVKTAGFQVIASSQSPLISVFAWRRKPCPLLLRRSGTFLQEHVRFS